MMRTTCLTRVSSLREGPPTRRDLASDTFTPSFSIEKHFVLQPTLCAPIFHIPLTLFNFEYTQELLLPDLSLPRSTHMDYRIFNNVFVRATRRSPVFFCFLASVAPCLSSESRAVTHKDNLSTENDGGIASCLAS